MALVRTLHAWAGAALALVLMVLGLSGALLVFKDDWVRLTVPAARVAPATTPQALGAAAEAAEASAPGRMRSIVFARPGMGVHRLSRTDGVDAYAAADRHTLAEWRGGGRPETWLFELHHRLLSGKTGETVTGVVGLAGAVLVLTGLVVWAPVWRRFAARIWPRTARRRDLLAAHRDLGVIFALPILGLCLTGAAMVFDAPARAGLAALFPGPEGAPVATRAGTGDVDWPAALTAAQAAFPDAALRIAAWPRQPGAPVTVRLRRPGEWHPNGRTVVAVDPATNQVLSTTDAQSLGRGLRLFNVLYPIHSAAVGGRIYDAVVFASGLALAGLGGVGLWSFLIKPRRRPRP